MLAYDAVTDTWTTKCPIQVPREWGAAASVGGVVYAIGGYDYATGNTWASVESAVVGPAPTPPSAPASLVATGVSGAVSLTWSPATPGNSPVTGYWILRSTCSGCAPDVSYWAGWWTTAYADYAVVTGATYWYLIVAEDADSNDGPPSLAASATVPPCTDPVWSYRAPMSTVRYAHAAATLAGRIYVAGGIDDVGNLASMESYDPASDTWTARSPLPDPDTALLLATIGGTLYAVCYPGSPRLYAYDPVTDTWATKTPAMNEHTAGAAVTVNGKLYAIGGLDAGFSTSVEAYDPETDTWITKTPLPTGRMYTAAAAVNGLIYVTGGYDIFWTPLSTVEAYDPNTDTWMTVTSMPAGRGLLSATAAGNTIYVVGGEDELVQHRRDCLRLRSRCRHVDQQVLNAGSPRILGRRLGRRGGLRDRRNRLVVGHHPGLRRGDRARGPAVDPAIGAGHARGHRRDGPDRAQLEPGGRGNLPSHGVRSLPRHVLDLRVHLAGLHRLLGDNVRGPRPPRRRFLLV